MALGAVDIPRGAPRRGKEAMSSKRPATAADAATAVAENKKFKSAIDEIADEYICPITQELPLDPVIAEDSKIYERTAIEAHIRARAGRSLKSPITNMPMGPRLMASTQVKNTIEKLVRSGAIAGDKAEQWLKRLSDEELTKTTMEKAKRGDVGAMADLSDWFFFGEHSLRKSETWAYIWAEKGARLRDPRCLCLHACYSIDGVSGVPSNETHGLVLMAQAALLGSKRAAFVMAGRYRYGLTSLPKDDAQALFWSKRVLENTVDDLPTRSNVDFMKKSADMVKELEGLPILPVPAVSSDEEEGDSEEF